MTWKTSMIEHHKADIERMKTSIEWLESGKMDVGEVDAAGWKTSLKNESVELLLPRLPLLCTGKAFK